MLRHVDASRDLYFISSEREALGGAQPYFFFVSFPCPQDNERDWPACKVPGSFFRVGSQYVNVRNNSEGLDAFRVFFKQPPEPQSHGSTVQLTFICSKACSWRDVDFV